MRLGKGGVGGDLREVTLGATSALHMNAVIAGRKNEAALGVEDRGKTEHRKRRSGRRRKHAGGVIAGGEGSSSGIDERLLKLRVCGTPQDEDSRAKKRQIRAAIELGGTHGDRPKSTLTKL
jgi:hypothetical protein